MRSVASSFTADSTRGIRALLRMASGAFRWVTLRCRPRPPSARRIFRGTRLTRPAGGPDYADLSVRPHRDLLVHLHPDSA
jgi:hypothetical protein